MTTAPSIDPTLEAQRQELAELIRRHASEPHGPASAIDDLYLVRYVENIRSVPTLAQPAMCIMAQGSKSLFLGDEHYAYDPLHYMVVSVTLPLSGVKLEASPENPCLGIRLDLDPAEISRLIAESGPMLVPNLPSGRGLYVERTDPQLLDALLRLVRLFVGKFSIVCCVGLRVTACTKSPWPTARPTASARPSPGSMRTSSNPCASRTWPAKSTSACRPCTTASRR
jgi:hypothetical protein